MPTNAIYGYLSILLKIVKDRNPDYVVICADRKEPSFRKDIYQEYKANRKEMPEELVPQVEYINKVGAVLGFPIVDKLGFEADDIIGTMALWGKKNNFDVFIVSGDKDFAQLVDKNITIYDPSKGETIGVEEVRAKWGVNNTQFIDYLSLVGDSSDNVPGVKGIGPKGAQKLLEQFSTLEGIYSSLDQLKGSTLEKLKLNQENALVSKKLVTIVTDVPIEMSEELFLRKSIDSTTMQSLYQELGFKSFERDFASQSAIANKTAGSGSNVTIESTSEKGKNLERRLESINSNEYSAKIIPFVRKVTSNNPINLPPMQSSSLQFDDSSPQSENTFPQAKSVFDDLDKIPVKKIVKVSDLDSHISDGSTLWIDFEDELVIAIVDDVGADQALISAANSSSMNSTSANLKCAKMKSFFVIEEERHLLLPWLLKKKINLMGFDLKSLFHKICPMDFDLNIFSQLSFTIFWDTSLANYVLDSSKEAQLSQIQKKFYPEELRLAQGSKERLYIQNIILNSIRQKLKEDGTWFLYFNSELPLMLILFEMEKRGITIDCDLLLEQSKNLREELIVVEKEIVDLAGEEFNVGSPKQLSHILFDKLGLPKGKKTKTGYSTDNDVLESLQEKHPIAKKVLLYREVAKLKSTYVDTFPQLVDLNHRIHTTFRQAFTATGRLSSVDPNLQNIPIRTARGAKIRKAFVASSGNVLLSADYSQIELRILAHFCDDPQMIGAFRDRLDIHAATAAQVFGVPIKSVTDEQRRVAKSVNFGIAYGQGAFGLAENLHISRTEAQNIINNYFTQFPKVREYIHETPIAAKEKGFVTTLFGRKRFINEFQSQIPAVKKFGERAAINAPIQGTAADIVKLAMVELHRKIKSKMLLQIHDELIFEAPKDLLMSEYSEICKIMEQICTNVTTDAGTSISLKVPLIVNCGLGPNWDELDTISALKNSQ